MPVQPFVKLACERFNRIEMWKKWRVSDVVCECFRFVLVGLSTLRAGIAATSMERLK